MFAHRRLQWFWLAGFCLVGGLTGIWSPSLRMADDGAHIERVVRRRADLPAPQPAILPAPAAAIQPAPLRVEAPTIVTESPVLHSDLDIPADPPAVLRLEPAKFNAGRRAAIPESIWLSGSIESLDETR